MRIAWLLLLVASRASAENKPDADAWYPRLSVGVGIGFRAGDLAVLAPQSANATARVDVKVRPALFVGATLDYAPGTARDEMLARDLAIRTRTVGVDVRSLLMSFGDKPSSFGGDLYVTGGIAREWIDWTGGEMQRNVLALGAGTTLIAPHDGETHRHFRFGIRVLVGRAPEPAKRPEGCDGPCDTTTATEPYDLSFVMEVSCHVGR